MFQNVLDPSFIFRLIAILVGLVLHEFAHALAADWLGDRTARLAGRVTLNPLAHLDPLGLIMILFAPIGWAKPTPVDPGRLRHPRSGAALVALAGPVMNLLVALVGLLVLVNGFPAPVSLVGFLPQALWWLVSVNAYLFIFNLIPIPPLDGGHILSNLLPYRAERRYRVLEAYGPFLLLLLVLIPPIRNHVLYPLLNGTLAVLLHLFGMRGVW
ncbi:MAG: site-2 protease family protein [Alicyclobacillus sp.]|nr:site-2 protease family protein [Alicyclobacillus sp.]